MTRFVGGRMPLAGRHIINAVDHLFQKTSPFAHFLSNVWRIVEWVGGQCLGLISARRLLVCLTTPFPLLGHRVWCCGQQTRDC